MTFGEIIFCAIACAVSWVGMEIFRYRSEDAKIEWKKIFSEAALLLVGYLLVGYLILLFSAWMGTKMITTVFLAVGAVVLFYVAWFLVRKHTIKGYARSIVNFTAGGISASFKGKPHKIFNAVALCEKWRIEVPPLESLPQPTMDGKITCFVCGEHILGKQFHPFLNSPLSYRRLMRYNPFGRLRTRKERREHILKLYEWSRGMQYLLGFCSQECQASFILWNFYIPVTRWQRLRWPFLVIAWHFHRLFRRVFL